MKKVLLVIGLIVSSLSFQLTSTYALDGFDSVDIVTEDNYEEVDDYVQDDPGESKNEDIDTSKSRSSSSTYWVTSNGTKSFYDAEDNLVFKEGTLLVIDVSKWNGTIDWDTVNKSNIDGVIIRVGYGVSGVDGQLSANVEACNRLGIPYGLYLYSYAYDANYAYAEAVALVDRISDLDLDLSFPIYYDLEKFSSWTDSSGTTRSAPTTVSEYEEIVATFISTMNDLGYKNMVSVYSYRSYLETKLNSDVILPYVSWVAAYTKTLDYENSLSIFGMGWQYTSSGTIDGIDGNVDMSCFEGYLLTDYMPFKDVSSSYWYYDTILEAYQSGLVYGTDSTHFSPNGKMSRAMVATVLWRMAGTPNVSGISGFSDVKNNLWYSKAITWASNLGIISGYGNGKFGPDDPITREQMAVMLRNYCLKYKKMNTTSTNNLTDFSDYKKVSSFAKSAVAWAVDKGIISGTETKKLNPKNNATRAECTKMLLVTSKLGKST